VGKVYTGLSMSLDGFIAGPGHDVQQVFAWYSSGDIDYETPGTEMVVKVSRVSACSSTLAPSLSNWSARGWSRPPGVTHLEFRIVK
jgi:hypothetical protein